MDRFIIFTKKVIFYYSPWLLTHGIRIVAIVLATFILHRILRRIIKRAVRITHTHDNRVVQEIEEKRIKTLSNIIENSVKVTLFLISFFMILKEFGLDIIPLLTGAGILGLALGFGGQYLIRDIISGLFIILENQYRVGDLIKIDSIGGIVENITLRMTTIRDASGIVHHFPHGEIKQVSNLSKEFSRINLDIGVAYDTDLEAAIKVINRVGKELAADELWKDRIISAPQFVRVDSFTNSAVILKINCDVQPLKQMEVGGEMRKRLIESFKIEGVQFPLKQVIIHNNSV